MRCGPRLRRPLWYKAPRRSPIRARTISRPFQTLAKGDKLTITVERTDGGKLRCTGATWSDAVVYPGGR
jgi:hypothetical protein